MSLTRSNSHHHLCIYQIRSGIVHHGLLFLAITSIYHFLVVLGASFYTFQWDILLIETGFLTGLCFAPWRSLTLQCSGTQNESEQQVGSWPIRFLLFKLMFMSGVVKVQADCPTWQNLTALEFHFATQCVSSAISILHITFFVYKLLYLFNYSASWTIGMVCASASPSPVASWCCSHVHHWNTCCISIAISICYNAQGWSMAASFTSGAYHFNRIIQLFQSTYDGLVFTMHGWRWITCWPQESKKPKFSYLERITIGYVYILLVMGMQTNVLHWIYPGSYYGS